MSDDGEFGGGSPRVLGASRNGCTSNQVRRLVQFLSVTADEFDDNIGQW